MSFKTECTSALLLHDVRFRAPLPSDGGSDGVPFYPFFDVTATLA
jgi:hypothetical protein